MILEGQWDVAKLEISYASMSRNVIEGNFTLFDEKLSKSFNFYYLEPGLNPYITDINEAMNTLFQGKYNHSESCITVEMSRRRQKVEFYLANDGSGLAFFSLVLGYNFGSNVGNEFGVMLSGKGPHKPDFAYGIARIHSLTIYTYLIEYNTVGDAKAALLRCFFSFQSSRLETF